MREEKGKRESVYERERERVCMRGREREGVYARGKEREKRKDKYRWTDDYTSGWRRRE